jgi:hypothetical protein
MNLGKWIELIQNAGPKLQEALPHIIALIRILGGGPVRAGGISRQEHVEHAQKSEFKRLLKDGGVSEKEAKELADLASGSSAN